MIMLSRDHRFPRSILATSVLYLALASSPDFFVGSSGNGKYGNRHCGVDAFASLAFSPIGTSTQQRKNKNALIRGGIHGRRRGTAILEQPQRKRIVSPSLRASVSDPSVEDPESGTMSSGNQKVVVVLGGSGFIGRRVCKELVDNDVSCSNKVVSISRTGKPPVSYLDNGGDSSWSDKVEWIRHDLLTTSSSSRSGSLVEKLGGVLGQEEGIEATIVGCIGDLNPSETWFDYWGLGFDDERLLRDNGVVYERFLEDTKTIWQQNESFVRRFVLLSIDYTSQKCLEGPIEGYVDGKRLAEKRFLETLQQQQDGGGNDRTDDVIVIGLSSFVFGGKRFPTFGKVYRGLVESPFAKAYVQSNKALRSFSKTTPEDWVEEMLFSSPIDVDVAGKATAMAARGLVTREIVNDGQPRKQGFFNSSGLPVEYDDVLFVDGTHEIEKIVLRDGQLTRSPQSKQARASASSEPVWEGALIGKRPYLFPFPVALFFATFFWAIATQQFVQTTV